MALVAVARLKASPTMCCVLPMPDEAYFICPGLVAVMSATRSFTLR
jgi:hypothetical protein